MQSFIESRWFLALTVLLYLLLAGVLFYVMGARTKPEIELMLTKLIPQTLRANFLLIAIGVVLCWRDIAGAFRALFVAESRPFPLFSAGVWLLLIFIVGMILVSQVAPQIHRIYYDEDIYANMGQNIACTGQAGMANYATFEYGEYFVHWLIYNKDPAGWPFLMSMVFQLFGTDQTFAFYLNNMLFAGGILVVFFIVRIITGGSRFPALLAALIYALIPHSLIWANTISAENAAAVFGGLAVLCALAWLRTREPRRLFLLAAVLPFACHMRPESALIALLIFAAAAVNLFAGRTRTENPLNPSNGSSRPEDTRNQSTGHPILEDASLESAQTSESPFRHPFATRAFWAMGLIAFALFIPLVFHFYAVSGQSWGAEGAKFGTSFFMKNVAINGPYFFNNREFPVLFTLFALIGLAAWKARRGPNGGLGREEQRVDFRSVLLMLLWFLLFWGIFLFFYAGSYKYGADVRFALVCFMPLAALAGIGGEVLRGWLEGMLPFDSEHAERDASDDPEAVAPDQADFAYVEKPAREKKKGDSANHLPVTALLVVLLLISWLKFVPLIRTEGQEAWGARYDHKYAREFIRKIPNRSIVLTHIPTMFLLWGQNAIQAYAGINNPEIIRELMVRYNGHVYFHKSYWCNTPSDANRSICDGIALKYNLEPVAVAHEQSHEYGLYRMNFK